MWKGCNLTSPFKIKHMNKIYKLNSRKHGYFMFRIPQQLVLFRWIFKEAYKCTVSIKCTVQAKTSKAKQLTVPYSRSLLERFWNLNFILKGHGLHSNLYSRLLRVILLLYENFLFWFYYCCVVEMALLFMVVILWTKVFI